MIFKRKTSGELNDQLKKVMAEIDANPLNDPRTKAANELVEKCKAEGMEPEAINAKLSENGLASLEEIGMLVLKNSLALNRLHQKRKSLESQLDTR